MSISQDSIRKMLNKWYPAGLDKNSLQHLKKHGVSEQEIRFCCDHGLLLPYDNQGVWKYQITQKGKDFRDGKITLRL